MIDFLTNGGDALRAYPEYSRIVAVDGRFIVESDEIARRHRMSIGTIVGDAQIGVVYMRGSPLGSVEESFIARLKPGDRFVFAGTPLEFVRVRDMKAWVKRAPNAKGAIPRWAGSRMPLSGELAAMLRARLGEAAAGVYRGAEMEAVRPLLEVQRKWSRIPAAERTADRAREDARGMASVRLSVRGHGSCTKEWPRCSRIDCRESRRSRFRWRRTTMGSSCCRRSSRRCSKGSTTVCFSPDGLLDDITAALNAAEMAKRQFRELARIAGLVFPGLPRSGKTARQLQVSSGLFFDVLAAIRSEEPAAVAGRARSVGATAREHASRQNARPHRAFDGRSSPSRGGRRRSHFRWSSIATASECRPNRSAIACAECRWRSSAPPDERA